MKSTHFLLLSVLFFLFTAPSFFGHFIRSAEAQTDQSLRALPHASSEEDQAAVNANLATQKKQARFPHRGLPVFRPHSEEGESIRPFAEYEHTAIVAFSYFDVSDAPTMKVNIAQNLPDGVKLMITVRDDAEAAAAKSLYLPYLPADRMLITKTAQGGAGSFWLRDAMPYPVIQTKADGTKSWYGVDARYYPSYHFDPDQAIGRALNVPIKSHAYVYFGGNLIANTKGNCFRVDSVRGRGVPFEVFKNFYGCKTLVEFPQRGGIGDIDERIKFLSDEIAVTDTPDYVAMLEASGFRVTMIPKAGDSKYQTYANALLVNGTLFLPIFGRPEDAEAIRIYESLGLVVKPALTPLLSNQALGNTHCFSMNYPSEVVDVL